MKRIYISQLYRDEENNAPSDSIFVLDWESKEILFSPEMPPEEWTVPIRAVSRSVGTRGLAWYQGHLWAVGSVGGLFKIDPDSGELIEEFQIDQIVHPHLMKVKGDLLYITSTGRDSLVAFDGKQVVGECLLKDIPGLPALVKPLIDPLRDGREWGDDKLHFNSVAWDEEGNEYHTYMWCHAIVDVTNLRVIEKGILAPHDLEIAGGRIYYSASNDRSTHSVGLESGSRSTVFRKQIPDDELERRRKFKETNEGQVFPYVSLTRGIKIYKNLLFLCNAPGTISCLDLNKHGKVVGEMEYCESKAAQPFDILLDPRDWQ